MSKRTAKTVNAPSGNHVEFPLGGRLHEVVETGTLAGPYYGQPLEAPPTWRDDYKRGFRAADDGRIEPLTKAEARPLLPAPSTSTWPPEPRRRHAKRGGS